MFAMGPVSTCATNVTELIGADGAEVLDESKLLSERKRIVLTVRGQVLVRAGE